MAHITAVVATILAILVFYHPQELYHLITANGHIAPPDATPR